MPRKKVTPEAAMARALERMDLFLALHIEGIPVPDGFSLTPAECRSVRVALAAYRPKI
jgi:hypothetical protein